ncbi:hypothetical protein PM082_005981 [Marasmius tenuissimus]|nr:hypothetical protein PM082_005981 [Marasmius tenuissimus]
MCNNLFLLNLAVVALVATVVGATLDPNDDRLDARIPRADLKEEVEGGSVIRTTEEGEEQDGVGSLEGAEGETADSVLKRPLPRSTNNATSQGVFKNT